MAYVISDECVSCGTCAAECPAEAISEGAEHFEIDADACLDCGTCADACPTEGAIVWDMPYTAEYNAYYVAGHESGIYNIREHKKNGIMFPEVSPKPYREAISIAARQAHTPVAE